MLNPARAQIMTSISAATSYIRGLSLYGVDFFRLDPGSFNLSSEADVCQHHKTFFLKVSER